MVGDEHVGERRKAREETVIVVLPPAIPFRDGSRFGVGSCSRWCSEISRSHRSLYPRPRASRHAIRTDENHRGRGAGARTPLPLRSRMATISLHDRMTSLTPNSIQQYVAGDQAMLQGTECAPASENGQCERLVISIASTDSLLAPVEPSMRCSLCARDTYARVRQPTPGAPSMSDSLGMTSLALGGRTSVHSSARLAESAGAVMQHVRFKAGHARATTERILLVGGRKPQSEVVLPQEWSCRKRGCWRRGRARTQSTSVAASP